jgi:eukaryotic-like serine/threonine-protein kinase
MKLSATEMAQMGRLLDEALPLGEAERRAWLERLPEEHRALTEALRSALLPGVAEALKAEALSGLPELELPPDGCGVGGLQAGTRIGPYELLRPLGMGGMAEVWLARRADGAFKREVALKLPRQAPLQEALSQRFARECEILASLEHPLIARLYDAGIGKGGQPYLAMEYVRGEALTTRCDQQGLGVRARVQLFLQILEAVQFAHDKQIIHRDLKPSNILVTDSGQVRLLDFGIAKLLADGTGGSAQLTGLYGRALTPDYASPELLRGDDPLDVRSDLYSLGVVLYELLSGTRPHRLRTAAAMGLMDRAADALEPQPPSTRIEPQAAQARAASQAVLQRALHGDLDAIVLKALARDPVQRYQSALGFAQDLQLYLQGKPIRALPARVGDRVRKFARRNRVPVVIGALALLVVLASIGYELHRDRIMRVTVTAAADAAFAPPEHSIAVLPFVNLSADKEQEYFSDGLTEELMNSLASIEGLQVAGRTSSFYFKGKDVELGTVARKLDVGAVLEGSVRRSAQTIRVTAQLTNAVTGFRLWSKTYDRDLGDVLKLQTEIATDVAESLKVTLLKDVAAKVELGGTRNPAAFDAYLRGRKGLEQNEAESYLDAISAYTEATHLDPHYAQAFAERSLTYTFYAQQFATGSAIREDLDKASKDAHQALALAPDLAAGQLALAQFLNVTLQFAQAREAYERARILAPGNALLLRESGRFAVTMGQTEPGLAALRRAVVLDPMDPRNHFGLGYGLYHSRQYREAIAAQTNAISVDADFETAYGQRGLSYYGLGDLEHARTSCEAKPGFWVSQWCLAVTDEKLGRHADAEAELKKMQTTLGDAAAFQYATIYAQWGNTSKALDWLDTARRLSDPGLVTLKTEPLLDPLRGQPRFQAMVRELKFPD